MNRKLKIVFLCKLVMKILETSVKRWFNIPTIPYKVNILTTYHCNLRCDMCKNWKRKTKKREYLSVDEWDSFFSNMGKNLYWVSITGGEPVLRNNLTKIAYSLNKKCKNLGVFIIATNGYSTDIIINQIKKILKLLDKGIEFYITISLDGFEKTHDKIRGVSGSWKQARKTFYLLEELKRKNSKDYQNLHIEYEITISNNNKLEMPNFLEWLNKLKNPYTITFAQQSWEYNNLGKNLLNPQKIDLDNIIKISANNKKNNYIKNLFLKLLKYYCSNQKKQVIPCYSLWSYIAIDPYGNVYPCNGFDVKLGNLKDYQFNLKRLLNNPTSREIYKKIKDGFCPNCWTPCSAYLGILHNPLHSLFKQTQHK